MPERQRCPTCGREPTQLEDFEVITLLVVEPQKLDEDALVQIAGQPLFEQVRSAFNSPDLREYLQTLSRYQEIPISRLHLKPTFKESPVFHGTYEVPESNLFIKLFPDFEKNTARLVLGQLRDGDTHFVGLTDLARIKFKGYWPILNR